MPLRFSEQTTETGMRYLRVDASDHVALEDAKAFGDRVMSPEWHHGLIMSVVAKGTEYAPDARKYFPTLNKEITALATVVTSPIVRAAINMMLRLGRIMEDNPLRMFSSEAEALKWLESQRGESEARRARL